MLKLYDSIFSETFKSKFEEVIIKLALVSFVIHLSLIFFNQVFPNEIFADFGLLSNPISAIYTPFSFILVSEVYLLIYYIPRSFTQSVAKQYEVVALIIIRKIFKDISNIQLELDWFSHEYNSKLTVDMISIILIFLLIGLFHATNNSLAKSKANEETEKFIFSKKRISVILFFIFVMLSFYHFTDWSFSVYQYFEDTSNTMQHVNPIFYDDFFTVLIIMDVWLLIVSFKYTNNYFSLMRNSGFIISTILIRLGISNSSLVSTPIMLISIAFGWTILLIFKKYYRASTL